MLFFATIGFFLQKIEFPIPPLIIGFVLTKNLEVYFRQAVSLAYGDWLTFVRDPVSLAFYGIAAFFLTRSIYKAYTTVPKPKVLPPNECEGED